MKKLTPLLLFGVFTQILNPAFAHSAEYVDCVEVVRASLVYYSSTEYEIKVANKCGTDLGTVYLDFDTGSYSSYVSTPRVSIWNLSDWGTSKTIYMYGIKPGYYSPTVKITASKDYSWKRVRLPSFTISKPSSSGSTSYDPQPVATPAPIAVPTTSKCEKIDASEILNSLNESLNLLEMAKTISTGYSSEIITLNLTAEKIKVDAQRDVCATGAADLDSKLKLAKLTLQADIVARIRTLIVDMTNFVLIIQKTPNKPKSIIYCQKGKLVKKVTAVNPICPAGYKLKA